LETKQSKQSGSETKKPGTRLSFTLQKEAGKDTFGCRAQGEQISSCGAKRASTFDVGAAASLRATRCAVRCVFACVVENRDFS
jgi:hypothetical protein